MPEHPDNRRQGPPDDLDDLHISLRAPLASFDTIDLGDEDSLSSRQSSATASPIHSVNQTQNKNLQPNKI